MEKKRINKNITLLFFIVLIALFFRLWRLKTFQYWSDDEQLLWMIVRHIIVDKHLSLATPNAALEIGLGPIFHYLLIPWFWFVKLNPEKTLLLGIVFSIPSILMFYKTGSLIAGRKVGLISAFLYSSSFMSSLFDRRLWALTPNVLLILIAIYSLLKIIKGKSVYLVSLAIPAAFAFNSDPSLMVIILSSLIVFLLLRPRIRKKYLITAVLVFLILLSPLLVFQLRHSFQKIKSANLAANKSGQYSLISQMENFSRFFYTTKTNAADSYFCYCTLDEKRPVLITAATILLIFYFIITTFKQKNKDYLVLLVVVFVYLFGIYIFKTFFNGEPAFFYSVTISPAIILILTIIVSKLNRSLLGIFLALYLTINLHTLSSSNFKYPLADKLELVERTIKKIPDKNNFSLYYSGDILLAGGGWTSLFIYKEYVPVRGNLSLYWGHVYNSYQLYPRIFAESDPRTIVILTEKNNRATSYIYDNIKRTFYYKINLEELYQPKYFE